MLFGFIMGIGYTYLSGYAGSPWCFIGGFLTSFAHLILMWIMTNSAVGHDNRTEYQITYSAVCLSAALLFQGLWFG